MCNVEFTCVLVLTEVKIFYMQIHYLPRLDNEIPTALSIQI